MCSNETKTEKAGEKMVCKLKTIRADMLVLQCTKTLKELLGNKYEVFDEPPKKGKER